MYVSANHVGVYMNKYGVLTLSVCVRSYIGGFKFLLLEYEKMERTFQRKQILFKEQGGFILQARLAVYRCDIFVTLVELFKCACKRRQLPSIAS